MTSAGHLLYDYTHITIRARVAIVRAVQANLGSSSKYGHCVSCEQEDDLRRLTALYVLCQRSLSRYRCATHYLGSADNLISELAKALSILTEKDEMHSRAFSKLHSVLQST